MNQYQANKKAPCKFGKNCSKADCPFDHTNAQCKFFLAGQCVKGNSCPYRHDLTEAPKVASFAATQQDTSTTEETKTAPKPQVFNPAAINDPKVIKDLIAQQSK